MTDDELGKPTRSKPPEAAEVAEPDRKGPGGYCICVHCGQEAPPVAGKTCQEQPCPHCGAAMVDNDATPE